MFVVLIEVCCRIFCLLTEFLSDIYCPDLSESVAETNGDGGFFEQSILGAVGVQNQDNIVLVSTICKMKVENVPYISGFCAMQFLLISKYSKYPKIHERKRPSS